jgi:hypothetical protein
MVHTAPVRAQYRHGPGTYFGQLSFGRESQPDEESLTRVNTLRRSLISWRQTLRGNPTFVFLLRQRSQLLWTRWAFGALLLDGAGARGGAAEDSAISFR